MSIGKTNSVKEESSLIKKGDKNMTMFDRNKNELIPLLHNVGDKIMGHENSVGVDMLVGGTIIEVRQSTSCLSDNSYNVELVPEVFTEECKGTWWISEKDVKPFKQDVWDRTVKHWKEHCRLKMFKALREENDEI
jgi:hypothetical protein